MNGRPLFVGAYEGGNGPLPYRAAGPSWYEEIALILGIGAAPFASLGSIHRKDGGFFCLFAHPLIFSLSATARCLSTKIAPATIKRTIARTIPTMEPVGIPCDDATPDGAAVSILGPLLFAETEGVGTGINGVRVVPGEEGMGAGAGVLGRGGELDDRVVSGGGTKTVTVGVTTGFEEIGC